MARAKTSDRQGALFEEDYLLRTLGAIARDPDVALTELVANSRDAGASSVDLKLPEERGGTLVVTDDGGLTDFATVRLLPTDIRPDSTKNVVNLKSKGVLPTALLASLVFDVTTIDIITLRMGIGGASIAHAGGHFEDVNGDGLIDLLLHFNTAELGADASTTQLCVTGLLTDGQEFQGCDNVRIIGK